MTSAEARRYVWSALYSTLRIDLSGEDPDGDDPGPCRTDDGDHYIRGLALDPGERRAVIKAGEEILSEILQRKDES